MPNYDSAYTGAEIDESVGSYLSAKTSGGYIDANTLAGIVATVKLTMYPVGSIYMSVENTDPGTFIGGTWQRIQDTFLLAAGSTYAAGGSGGNASHTHGYVHTHTTPATTTDSYTLKEADVPSHTHTRGTMNITGYLGLGWGDASAISLILGRRSGGAVYGRAGNIGGKFMNGGVSYNQGAYADELVFDASRDWSGATSSYGGGAAIPMVKKPPQPIHKVLQQPIPVQVSLHISPYTSGNVLHKAIRYTKKGGVTYA